MVLLNDLKFSWGGGGLIDLTKVRSLQISLY